MSDWIFVVLAEPFIDCNDDQSICYGDDDWTPNKEWWDETKKKSQRYKEYLNNPSNLDAMTEEEKEEMKEWLKKYYDYGGSSASAANQTHKKWMLLNSRITY